VSAEEQPAPLHIPGDNRPAPLRGGPLAIWQDELSQMSFGERSALEGVLSQLRPRLALEIGTYEGGSLSFLARHCGHVHTLDLHDLVADRRSYANVTFHTGDSAELLPALLGELEREGQELDLALIDGDHSAEGVRKDLQNLLDSATTRATVILLHDTMNEETRAGIESAGLSEHPKVVYHELDFVPGYEFVGGHFDGQVWGGLGLVLTGEQSFEGYREGTAQTRYRRPFELLHDARRLHRELLTSQEQIDRLRAQADAAAVEADRARAVLRAMQASVSWRVTKPLRSLKRALLARRS
jgi:hypothetical protein